MAQSQFPSFLQSNTSDGFLEWIRSNLNTSFSLNRITKDFHPGEAIHPGQAVRVGTDGNLYKSSDSDGEYIGIIESWDGGIFRVVVAGVCNVAGSGWTAGQIYYIAPDGYLSPTVTSRQVGVGIAQDTIIVLPESSNSSTGGITSIATSSPITGGTITTSGTIRITLADTSTDGYLSSVDWNVFNSKVTSISGGTGISIGGTTTVPIITNNAPDQTVVLSNGTGISVTGTYPNFTITNTSTSSGGTVTSVSGTTNRITVATGTTTPVIDISASYAGQSSITTLGTVTTGVWNGTSIANANLANSSLTIGSTNIALGATSTTLAGLTSVTSAGFTGALTGNASTATALATGRTISITGDLAYTSPSFDGSSNITAAGTLATVNSNVGSFGSATQTGTFTANGKGLITAAANVTITPAVGSITGLGTGVATALAINVGSAGAFITFNGAGGTPSSITLTNGTGLPESGVTNLVSDLALKAPLASPTFTGTVVIPTPFTLGAVSVTSTGTQLNYLNQATGTTGTLTSNVVFSGAPAFTGTVTNSGAVVVNGTSLLFRTTNAGSNITSTQMVDLDGSISVAGAQGIAFETATGLGWTHANGTRRILGAALKLANLTNTAGSEASDLAIFTQSGGTAATTKFTISAKGNILTAVPGALATNATDGFLYMPTCAGTPSGTPTAATGMVPFVYDTTNNIIYIYNGAWKKTAALT